MITKRPDLEKYLGGVGFLIFVYLLTRNHERVRPVFDLLVAEMVRVTPQADGDDGRTFYG